MISIMHEPKRWVCRRHCAHADRMLPVPFFTHTGARVYPVVKSYQYPSAVDLSAVLLPSRDISLQDTSRQVSPTICPFHSAGTARSERGSDPLFSAHIFFFSQILCIPAPPLFLLCANGLTVPFLGARVCSTAFFRHVAQMSSALAGFLTLSTAWLLQPLGHKVALLFSSYSGVPSDVLSLRTHINVAAILEQ